MNLFSKHPQETRQHNRARRGGPCAGILVLLCVATMISAPLAVAQAPTATQKKADLEALRGPELRPTTFTYQGELKDANGPANGGYDLQFILYTAQTGGDELGSVVHENTVLTNGLFTVQLGAPLPTGSSGPAGGVRSQAFSEEMLHVA